MGVGLIVVALSSSGCMTVFYGRTQEVAIEVVPADANVIVYPGNVSLDGEAGVELTRSRNHTVRVTREGWSPRVVAIDSVFREGRAVASAFLGLGIFAFVDLGTGALYDLHPDRLVIELERPQSVATKADPIDRPPREGQAALDHFR